MAKITIFGKEWMLLHVVLNFPGKQFSLLYTTAWLIGFHIMDYGSLQFYRVDHPSRIMDYILMIILIWNT